MNKEEKNIDEVLDEQEYNSKAKPTLEADASCNIVGYYKGFRIMTTQRNPALSMKMYIDKAISDIDYMLDKGFKPSWNEQTNGQISTKDASTTQDNLGNCAKCGAPNKLSKRGKTYCSNTCWIK